MLAMVLKKPCFFAPLALVISTADANGIHVTLIAFKLGMHAWVTIDLAGASWRDARIKSLGQAQYISSPVHADFGRLHQIKLVVNRTSWGGQVMNQIQFDVQQESCLVSNEVKTRVVAQMFNFALGTCEEVVRTHNLISLREQSINQMRTQKAGAASDQDTFALIEISHDRKFSGCSPCLALCVVDR